MLSSIFSKTGVVLSVADVLYLPFKASCTDSESRIDEMSEIFLEVGLTNSKKEENCFLMLTEINFAYQSLKSKMDKQNHLIIISIYRQLSLSQSPGDQKKILRVISSLR